MLPGSAKDEERAANTGRRSEQRAVLPGSAKNEERAAKTGRRSKQRALLPGSARDKKSNKLQHKTLIYHKEFQRVLLTLNIISSHFCAKHATYIHTQAIFSTILQHKILYVSRYFTHTHTHTHTTHTHAHTHTHRYNFYVILAIFYIFIPYLTLCTEKEPFCMPAARSWPSGEKANERTA